MNTSLTANCFFKQPSNSNKQDNVIDSCYPTVLDYNVVYVACSVGKVLLGSLCYTPVTC